MTYYYLIGALVSAVWAIHLEVDYARPNQPGRSIGMGVFFVLLFAAGWPGAWVLMACVAYTSAAPPAKKFYNTLRNMGVSRARAGFETFRILLPSNPWRR